MSATVSDSREFSKGSVQLIENTVGQGTNAGQHTTLANNLIYDNADEEPILHARTYLALGSMFLLNLVQVVALQGPPLVVCDA